MIHWECVTVDIRVTPIAGVMAARALLRPVPGGCGMAGLAVGQSLVGEAGATP
jgi:hypothetical protein